MIVNSRFPSSEGLLHSGSPNHDYHSRHLSEGLHGYWGGLINREEKQSGTHNLIKMVKEKRKYWWWWTVDSYCFPIIKMENYKTNFLIYGYPGQKNKIKISAKHTGMVWSLETEAKKDAN